MVFGRRDFGRLSGQEDRALMKAVCCCSLISAMWGYSKGASICKPGRGSSPETYLVGILILNFPAFRTVRNKFLMFKPPSLWYLCYSCPNWLRWMVCNGSGSHQGERLEVFPFSMFLFSRSPHLPLPQLGLSDSVSLRSLYSPARLREGSCCLEKFAEIFLFFCPIPQPCLQSEVVTFKGSTTTPGLLLTGFPTNG